MGTFGNVYRYEWKKIWDRRLVKISFALCLVLVVISGTVRLFGSYVVDGKVLGTTYEETRRDQAYARALNGRAIDQQLLEEMTAAYQKVPLLQGTHYTGTPEYQTYARPYSAIFNFTIGNTDLLPEDIIETWQPSQQQLYQQRQIWLEGLWEGSELSQGEVQFWQQRESQVAKPLVFQEHEGYTQIFDFLQTLGFVIILFVSVALSGIFPEEHSRRTDQLVLSSPKGKTTLYWAKISAGITCAAGAALVFFALLAAVTFTLYGTDGFHAAFQLLYSRNSDPITCGQALLISLGNVLVTAVTVGALVMMLSELLHSSMAALAVSAGLLTASMAISVPNYIRWLSQLWDWQPWSFMAGWNIFGRYTLPVLGAYLTPWQAVPLIYLLLMALAAWGARAAYRRYQVSGR